MRLKRVLGAVLSGAMVLSLAACGGGGDAETTAASKAEETSKEAAKETEAEKKDDAKETEAAKGGEEINKRIAYVVGNLGDKSFNDSGEEKRAGTARPSRSATRPRLINGRT